MTTTTSQSDQMTLKNSSAIGLLLITGLLLALSTNMAKLLPTLKLSPLPFLFWSLIGALFVLSLKAQRKLRAMPLASHPWHYYLVSGLLTSAAANLIFISAVPVLGVGFISLLLALPPALTYLGALLFRWESFQLRRAFGVLCALAGAGLLVWQRVQVPNANHYWIGLALLGPVCLAAGNLYRSLCWPKGATPETLAPGMLLGALIALGVYAFLTKTPLLIAMNGVQTTLIVTQAFVFAGQFLLMFALQKKGGPVLLSLMGSVSSVFGVPLAMILFNEILEPLFPLSLLLVFAGMVYLKQKNSNAA